MSRTMDRAARLVAIEAYLFQAKDGRKVSEIAERFRIHGSKVYRDILSLSESGTPIWEDKGRFGVLRDRYLTPVRVTLNEAMSLFIAARLLSSHSDEHNPHVVAALEKLAVAVPKSIGKHISQTAAVADTRRPHPDYIRNLDILTRAWSDSKQVRLIYHNPQTEETTDRIVDTYFLEPSAHGFGCYLIGYDHLREDVREFKVERIQKATLLESEFEPTHTFDPYDYLAHSWGIMGGEKVEEVTLRFTPDVAYRVRESFWPGLVSLTAESDGGIRLRVRVKHIVEMKPWIRSWGPECEVISPEELRQEIASDMTEAGRRYKGGP